MLDPAVRLDTLHAAGELDGVSLLKVRSALLSRALSENDGAVLPLPLPAGYPGR